MATENHVIVELYDLVLTERKDDRFGRVVTTRSNKIDDLIKKAVARRTDLNASTLKASFEILKSIALEELTAGASVEFGLGYYSLGVNGIFIGDHARWDNSQHSLSIQVAPTAELRSMLKKTTVDVRGMASFGTVINSVTDVASGEVNSRITPGGGVNLAGSKIKIAGDLPEVGICLISEATGENFAIPMTSILVNEPSKVSFIVPAALPTNDYKLRIITQFSSSGINLKETRSYTFDYVLSVIA